MRYRSSLRSFAAPLSIVLAFTGCGEGNGAPRLERTDSAGVAILMTHSEDRAATFFSREIRSIGGSDSGAESFYKVATANTGVDANGNIYVLVPDAHRVVVFDSTGRHVRSLGKRGGGPGELQFPLGISVSPDGGVLVPDVGKRRIVQWNSDGQPLQELEMPQGSFAASVGWTGSGLVLPQQIAGTRQLLLLNESGDQIRFAAIKGLPTKNVNLNSCGMGFTNMPPIFSPDLTWTNRGNRVVVARNPHYIIDEYVDGRLIRSIRRNIPPRPATVEAAKASLGEGMRVRIPGRADRVCDPAEVVEQQGFSPHLPTIGRLAIAPDGRLWVQRYTPGDDSGPIDLFDSDGRYVETLPAESAFPLHFLPDGRMLTAETDVMDLQRLVIRALEMR